MSSTYAQRCATVVDVLSSAGVTPGKDEELSALAVRILAALDGQKEQIR